MKAMRGLKDATPTVRPESIPDVSDSISTHTESLTRIRNEEDSTAASVAKLKAADESTRATPKGSHNYEF